MPGRETTSFRWDRALLLASVVVSHSILAGGAGAMVVAGLEPPHGPTSLATGAEFATTRAAERETVAAEGSDRVLRFFDFDERKLGNPEVLPMHWEKREGSGLPHYVRGRMVGDVGRSSGRSFRMDLNGGSVAYRTESNLIPVRPGSAYRVDGFVKTTALDNARARLSAYLVDAVGTVIPGSLAESELYHGTGLGSDWKPLSVDLRAAEAIRKKAGAVGGDHAGEQGGEHGVEGRAGATGDAGDAAPKPAEGEHGSEGVAGGETPVAGEAAFLVVEVALLQPVLYAPSALGERTLFKEDVTGSAWFTDISVSQVPEVDITTESAGSIFPRGTPVRLWMTVSDRAAADLSMRVEVRDSAGNLVHQRSGPLEMDDSDAKRHRMMVSLPSLPAGWYEADLVLTTADATAGAGREVTRRRQAFIQLADDGKVVTPDARFGVIATGFKPAQWKVLPSLLSMLGAGRVKLTVWGETTDIQGADSAAFEALLEQLQADAIVPTGVIAALPPSVAAAAGTSSLARLSRLDEAVWKPQLSYLIAQHANHLDRWQLGLDGQDDFAKDPLCRAAYDAVYKAFDGLVHDPNVAVPWPASSEADKKLPPTVAISLPADVSPEQVGSYVQDTRDRGGGKMSLTMLPLDRKYSRAERLEDFGQRYVTALAAGADRIDLPLPFTADGQPEELLLGMRTLNQALAGAAYCGKIHLADGVVAHLFSKGGKGVLALWSLVRDENGQDVRINLGGKPSLLELTGRATVLRQASDAKEPGEMRVHVGGTPVLVEGIDPAVALFRVSVALDNPILESSFKPHTRKLTFKNTFGDFISGNLILEGPEGWSVTPKTFAFSLNPGDSFSREITIEIPYNTLAGARPLKVKFQLPDQKPSAFTVPIDLKLGLNEVGLQTIATRDRADEKSGGQDVVVQLLITNHGQKNISYTAFALYPDQPRQERLVTDLAPGRTTVKRFRFKAPKTEDPKKIRVGLREIEGTKILNDEIMSP